MKYIITESQSSFIRRYEILDRLVIQAIEVVQEQDDICDYSFKDFLEEIEEFRVLLNIPKNKTFIMPAGDTREELVKMYPVVFDMCAEKGYNMTGRDHIIAFDTKRGV